MEMTTHWRIEWTNAKNEMETVVIEWFIGLR